MQDRLGKILLRMRIRQVLPRVSGRLLDIGCGTNQLVKQYTGLGTGVDVYPWEDSVTVVTDTAQLPYKSGSFDTVTIIAALNHIPNRQAVLREAWRVLTPGGRIILTMIPPRLSRAWHALRRPWDADQTQRGMKAGEVYGLTRGAVMELLAAAGFTDTQTSRFMGGLNTLFVATRPPEPKHQP